MADNGFDLNQGATDTIKQAFGAQPIPCDDLPNPGPRHGTPADWPSVEPALRYGHGARVHYHDSNWDDTLSARLRSEWEAGGNESTWGSVKEGVRWGWHGVRREL